MGRIVFTCQTCICVNTSFFDLVFVTSIRLNKTSIHPLAPFQLQVRGQRERAHLELVLLAVDDDGGDLLVHEDEDGAEQRGDDRHHGGPPRVGAQRTHVPAPVIPGRLGT